MISIIKIWPTKFHIRVNCLNKAVEVIKSMSQNDVLLQPPVYIKSLVQPKNWYDPYLTGK